MERCPNCRARYQGGERCRRCGMELGALLASEQGADALVRRALAALAEGDQDKARAALTRARALRHDPLTDALLGFALSFQEGGEQQRHHHAQDEEPPARPESGTPAPPERTGHHAAASGSGN
jgi:hypothetical protein